MKEKPGKDSRKMKILIVPGVDWFTALENRVHHLARVWRKKHELHIIHFPIGGAPLRGNEGDVIHRLSTAHTSGLLTYYIINFLPQIVQILRIAKKERIDIVITTNLSAGTAAIIVSKILGIPAIFDYCDYLPAFSRYAGKSAVLQPFLRKVGELLTFLNLRVADATVAIGRRLMEHARGHSRLFVEIPNGVDASRFPPDDKWAPGPFPTLGYVGIMEFFVDLPSAVRSLKSLQGSKLIIVGDGRERQRVAALSRDLGLEGRVEFVGRVPYEQVARWIKSMDICLLPFESSELTEAAIPLKIHEYAACRRPIISSPLFEVVRMYGDLLEYATGPEEISSKVRQIVTQRKTSLKRIRKAYLRSTMTYGWERFGKRYEEVFLRVSEGQGGKGGP